MSFYPATKCSAGHKSFDREVAERVRWYQGRNDEDGCTAGPTGYQRLTIFQRSSLSRSSRSRSGIQEDHWKLKLNSWRALFWPRSQITSRKSCFLLLITDWSASLKFLHWWLLCLFELSFILYPTNTRLVQIFFANAFRVRQRRTTEMAVEITNHP